jgi:branched-subunit amino acid transport protein
MRLSVLLVIIACAAVTYAARYGGFVAGGRAMPPLALRFLGYVPVAVFAALLTPDLLTGGDDQAPRLVAAAVAAAVAWRFGQLALCLVGGMTVYMLLRFGL